MSEIAVQLPSRHEFSALIDSIFKTSANGGGVFEICLVNVDDIVSNDIQDNFTLLFRAPLDAPQQQGIYRIEHEAIGAMDLFLVPVKQDDSGLYYEAVFNLLKAAAA
ncbi:MAG: hypothetical protein ABL952_00210 [Pyrinomonadaceae bacterium]